MNGARPTPPDPSVPERLMSRLLGLYPRAFRDRHGADMVAMTRDLADDARRARLGTAGLVIRLLSDTVTALPRAHRFERRLRRHRPPTNDPATPTRRKEKSMTTFRHDLLVAARRLRAHPGFTLVATLTLALGIGANTAIFSAVYGVLLRPLGVADAERLAVLSLHRENDVGDAMGLWPAHLESLEPKVVGRGIESLGSFLFDTLTLMGDHDPEELGTAVMVDGAFFATLGVEPVLGRVLDAGDVVPNRRGSVCVISEALWQGRFGGDPEIIGRVLILDNEPVTVAGVMPDQVPLPQAGIQVWMPHGWDVTDGRFFGRLGVLARLEPDSSFETAGDLLAASARELVEEFPRIDGYTLSLSPFRDTLVGTVRPALLGAFGAVGLILLIACANMASLMLSRAVMRGREIATRRALGAGHRQIASQLLAESVLLSLLGGAVGVVLAMVFHLLTTGWATGLIPRLSDVRLDLPVLAFAAAASISTGVVFGLAPVIFACGRDLASAMRGGVAAAARGHGTSGIVRSRQMLVIGQVAVAVVLVTTAALFIRSLGELRSVEPGFRSAGVGGARIYLDDVAYADDAAELGYFERLLERLRATPGIERAGVTSGLPLDALTIDYDLPYTLPGETEQDSTRQAHFRTISPDYLETLGVPLLRGRALSPRDRADTEAVAVINETFARVAWPDGDPVGEAFAIYGGRRQIRVVGVVGDVRFHGPGEATRPAFFVPFTQITYGAMAVVARGRGDIDVTRIVAETALEVDRAQPVHSTFTLAGLNRTAIAADRFYSHLLTAFAIVALLLAAAGIYGVVAYWVNESRRELGIRLAIGATGREIVGLILRRSLVTTTIGMILGLLVVRLAGRQLDPLLFAVRSTDGRALGAVVVLLGMIAMGASLVPALRAARIDPTTSLRAE